MWTVSLNCLETRTRVLTYYKECIKESTRCKTEHSDAKPKCKLHCILKANEFIEKTICIILFKTWFTCLDKEIFLCIIWIIILLLYFLIMIIFHIPKLWKKTDFSFIWRFGAFSQKQQHENGPCKLTSPWVAGRFQETDPLMESVSFPQYCDVH